MEKIFLYWFQRKGKKENFGDVLNPYLIKKITDSEVIFLPVTGSKLRRLFFFFLGALKQEINLKYLNNIIQSFKNKNQYVGIGSVLEHVSGKNCHVWGAGIINRKSKIHKVNFHAVRGEISRQRLIELGYNPPKTIGDPALLLPLIYKPIVKKKYQLGIVPHFVHHHRIIELLKDNSEILIVNVNDDVETVIQNILSCEYTISSSLHGIIVSHAYGIPCLWSKLSEEKLYGDNIKFYDYFSSVGIREYDTFNFIKNGDFEKISFITQTISANCDIESITNKIQVVQKDLLNAAPFKLASKYNLLKKINCGINYNSCF